MAIQACFVAMCCVLCSACTSVSHGPPGNSEALFHDQLFAPATEPISAQDVMALSDEMKQFLDGEIRPQARKDGAINSLVSALNHKSQIKIDYDAEVTRTAAQAFSARAGNCLSLVVMTAALARELGLQVSFQRVLIDEVWSRNQGFQVASGHVNLVLTLPATSINSALSPGLSSASWIRTSQSPSVVIDFLPPDLAVNMDAEKITEATVIAMYMNNRAIEALARGEIGNAYWWAKAAIQQQPDFMTAYNSLGVIYQRAGNKQMAHSAFQFVLQNDPVNEIAMSNEVVVLKDLGFESESKALAEKLKALLPYPPFYFFNLGVAAMNKHEFNTAKKMFNKEIERAPYNDEVHFWLALAHFQLGELQQAGVQLNLAIETSVTKKQHALYAAKLNSLKLYGMR